MQYRKSAQCAEFVIGGGAQALPPPPAPTHVPGGRMIEGFGAIEAAHDAGFLSASDHDNALSLQRKCPFCHMLAPPQRLNLSSR
jgi:hypothetical protein